MAGLEHGIDPLVYVLECRDVVHMDNLLVQYDFNFHGFNGEKADWLEFLKIQIPDGSDEFSKQG